MSAASTPSSSAPGVLRGSPHRRTNFMEQLQLGHVRAVAAAAGCVLAEFSFDDGVDLQATHRSDEHTFPGDKTARLEIQLKSTADLVTEKSSKISSEMRQDRWAYFRSQDTVKKIVVVMSIPESVDDWILAEHDSLRIKHSAYWVNLATLPDSSAIRPVVSAPTNQVFDDIALCSIMQRVGQGGDP